MQQNLKPAGYWASVITLGLVVGISLQMVRANWTAPTTTAPNGNIGAPINTGSGVQRKVNGTLGVDNAIVAGIAGTNVSTPPAPNGKSGNMYANDLWVNSAGGTGKWASQLGSSSTTPVQSGLYGYCTDLRNTTGGDCPGGIGDCRVVGSLMSCDGNVSTTGTRCKCAAGYTLVYTGDITYGMCTEEHAYSCLKN